MTFINDYSRFAWVYPLKAKFEVFMCFKQYVLMVENVSMLWRTSILIGGEYMSKELNAFMPICGIKHQCKMPYTPQQNKIANRKIWSLMEMARCIGKS